MFRELLRKNKQITYEECIELLKNETRGVLSVIGEGGYPYGMPMNHFYNEDDGNIYFHCGNIGHRLDALKRNDRVCFCTYNNGQQSDEDWALNVKSVIVFGRVEIIDDIKTVKYVSTQLSHKFTQDDEYIKKEIKAHAHRTLILKLKPENICGKIVKES